MEKFRGWLKKVSTFFTSLVNLSNYEQDRKKSEEKFDNISNILNSINTNIMDMGVSISKNTSEISQLRNDITKVKNGLQIELFRSLCSLHETLTSRGWASQEEKLDAKRYYDNIHELGQDGWSDSYYEDIVRLPESREQMYKK